LMNRTSFSYSVDSGQRKHTFATAVHYFHHATVI
jgi:hypothetical protein